MKTLYENDDENVEKGFMVVSGNGTALEVFDAGGYYDYSWWSIKDGTVFNTDTVNSLDDIGKYYRLNMFCDKERVKLYGIHIVPVVKTVKSHITIVEAVPQDGKHRCDKCGEVIDETSDWGNCTKCGDDLCPACAGGFNDDGECAACQPKPRRVQCNRCMSIVDEDRLKVDYKNETEACPVCGASDALMDV